MIRTLLLVLCWVFVCTIGSYGQTKVLTFEEAVKLGLKNGMLINQQKNTLEYNQMQYYSNIAGLGPTLNAGASANRVQGNTFNSNLGKVVNGLFDQVTGSLNANLNIFNGFAQVNKVRQGNALVNAQAFYVNRTAQDIINTIAGQYLTVLLDFELLTIARENSVAQRKQLEQVTEQVNVGSKSPVDQYNQESQTKAAEIKELQAEITFVNDKALLALTLLINPEEEFGVEKPAWDVNAIDVNKTELPALLETSLKNRGDYLRAVKNEDAARFGMKMMKGYMTPTLSVYGTLYSAYNYDHTATTNAPFDEQFKTSNYKKYYGIQLNIPILGGQQALQVRTNYIQQKVNYLNAQLTRKNAEITVKSDVVRAYQNYQLYAKTYTLTVDQLKAADTAFGLETERYNLGITTFVDYSNANKVFVQAQTDKAQAEYRLLFQKVLVDYAAGTLKPEAIEE